MGLMGCCYKFNGSLPSLGRMESKVHELSRHKVTISGALEPSQADEADAMRVNESRNSMPMRGNYVTFCNSDDLRRAPRYVTLGVSLDGTKMFLSGNDIRLFNLISKVLENLDGIPD